MVKKFNEFVNENYPWGAANDPNAPWNQSDPDMEYILELSEYGEVELIERNHISREPDNEDWEDEKTTIDPVYMDQFICKKLNLKYEDWEDDGIEITGIEDVDEKRLKYKFITAEGEFETNWDELEDVASGKFDN